MRTLSLSKARIALLAVGLAVTAVAPAGDRLAPQAPAGTDLSGRWELDTTRSDDPARVRAAWQRALPPPKPRERPAHDERRGPPAGDAGGPAPPATPAGPPAAMGAQELQRRDTPATSPLTGFLDAIANPPVLELRGSGTDIDVPRADGAVSCTPGDVVAVMDRHGDSERRCGWRGGALVVAQEVKRGPRREDRYELATDGTLAWSTTLTAKKSPPLVVHRSYRRNGAATGAFVPAAPRGVPAN